MNTLRYRPGTPDDNYPAFRVFQRAIHIVYYQYRLADTLELPDDETISDRWESWRSVYDHLGASAENFWVAELDGLLVGYARTINRSGLRELTELFLDPNLHSKGIGRELLGRVFMESGAKHRMIIATLDPRAQALYLTQGVYPRHPIYTFYRRPERVGWQGDLIFGDLPPGAHSLAQLAAIDEAVLGHGRDADHAWLLKDRRGFACLRNGRMVGYGYIGKTFSGPFALLQSEDFPAVLGYAETQAAEQDNEEFAVDVPMINREAVRYLLKRNFRMYQFLAYHMSDAPWGNFENYLYTSPIFFI